MAAGGGLGATKAQTLRYTGPVVLHTGSVLSAETPADRQIAAVTFRLDGRAVVTDAVAPYAASLLASDITAGHHVLRVELVYRSGNRRVSARVDVTATLKADPGRHVVSTTAGLRALIPRLARGRVAVHLKPGRYDVNELQLGSNVVLTGSGPATVLTTPTGAYGSGLVVNGTNVTVADLAIDGAGPGEGTGNSILVGPGAGHVVLRHLDLRRVRKTGVYGWGRIADVTLQDSTISGLTSAEAGVVFRMPDESDVSVVRTTITGMRGWGINFFQVPHDNLTTGLRALALDNLISDVDEAEYTNGTSKGGIWSGGAQATIVGNRIRRIGWDGIETVGSSDGVWISGNDISGTKTGIYLEHKTTHSVIRNNKIENVDTGVIVEWLYDGIGSTDNRFIDNRIAHADTGIFADYGADRNVLQGNTFLYGSRPAIVLQGSSNNVILDNQACGAAGAFVREQLANPGTGAVMSQGNVIARNRSLADCAG